MATDRRSKRFGFTVAQLTANSRPA